MKLFEPITINGIELRNRIVMPGMETNFGNEHGELTEKNFAYYELRAKGGAGLIIIEATYFDKVGRGTLNMLSIDKDSKIPKFKKLAETIKKHGAKAFVQIYHAGIQATSFLTGEQIVGPSDIPSKLTGVIPKPLSKKMIKKIIKGYVDASYRLKQAGFDGVEIHAGHGYLLNQFFSPLYNNRTDEYGGSLENRMRLAVEVLRAVKKKCGNNFVICFRLNCQDYIKGGLEVEDMAKIAAKLDQEGIDMINITAGIFDSPYYPVVPYMNQPRGVYSNYAAIIKKSVKNAVVCVVGRINTPEIAEEILSSGKADMVAMGRALITDPFFPQKVMEGRREAMKICPACNACLNQILIEEKLLCAVNPNVIDVYENIPKTENKMRILIIGAGPAGLEAATVLKIRGHEVLLIDKNDKIGGSLNIASAAPIKNEMKNVILNYHYILEKYGIEIKLNTPFSNEILEEFQPDAIILATGSKISVPQINGLEAIKYYNFHEVLNGSVPEGERIIVIGGGMIGIEVTDYLVNKGKRISLIEENAVIGADLYSLVGSELVQRIYDEKNVKVYTDTVIKSINDSKMACTCKGNELELQFDDIVLALEPKPNTNLEELLKKIVPKTFKIGDCKKRNVRKLLEAVSDGYEIGLTIETLEPEIIIEHLTSQGSLKDTVVSKVKNGSFDIEDIPDYLQLLIKICNENSKIQSKSKKTNLKFQFNILPGPSFWIQITNGKFTTGKGSLTNPDVVIEINKNIAAGIFTGEVNAASAYMSKQIKFLGPMRHGMKFQSWTNAVKKELNLE
ncbi:MAG: FAD-dependent oxidoreductase [Candidatus Thorarchaeota archaeon]